MSPKAGPSIAPRVGIGRMRCAKLATAGSAARPNDCWQSANMSKKEGAQKIEPELQA